MRSQQLCMMICNILEAGIEMRGIFGKLVTCILCTAFWVVTAHAANYVVDSTDDDAATDGTLRKEILDLNANGESTNTIIFSLADGSEIDITSNGYLEAIEQSITSFTSTGGTITLTNTDTTSYGLRFTDSGDLVGGISDDFIINVAASSEHGYGIYGMNALTIGDMGATITVDGAGGGARGISSRDTLTLGNVSGNITAYNFVNHAYGIYGYGSGIVINGNVSGVISASAGGNYASAINAEENDLVVNGDLGGTISATAVGQSAEAVYAYEDDILISGDLSANVTATAGEEDAYAIYAEGDNGDSDIWIGGDMSGNISATAGTDRAYGFFVNDHDITVDGNITGAISVKAGGDSAYAMYATDNIVIGGDFSGQVTAITGGSYAVGLHARDNLSLAGDLSGTIAATAETGHTAIGVCAQYGTLNGGSAGTAMDISGEISATANGLAVAIAANDAMNLNISGTVTATDSSLGGDNYSIRSGRDNGSGGWVDASADDTVQLSTGANIATQADLAGGTDSLTLDGTGTLSAEFLNTEELYKTSSGTWSLTADQTMNQTEVNGGTLAVNSTLTSSSVTVNSSGTLGGSGSIVGNVVNHGSVAPGNSPGTLTITGDYTQESGSTLEIEVASSAQDQLVVTGVTTINGGTLKVTVDEGVLVTDGTTYEFIDAQGGYAGAFDEYETNSVFLTLAADNSASIMGGVISRESYSIVAQDGNSATVGDTLYAAISSPSADLANALSALDLLPEEDAADTLSQLHPEPYSALTETSFVAMRLFAGAVQERIYAINDSTEQLSILNSGQLLSMANSGSLTELGLSAMNTDGQNVASTSGRQTGIYFTPVMQWEKYDTTDNRTGFEATTYGFVAGADFKPNDDLIVGIMGGYARTDTDFEAPNSSTADANHGTLGLYASYNPNEFYIDGIVQGGISDNEMKRHIDFSTSTYEAKSDFYSYNFATSLTTGYFFTKENYTFGPVVSLNYGYVNSESFSESGAPGLNLAVEGDSVNSLKSVLGGRVKATYDIGNATTIVPVLSAMWSHEYLNDSRSIVSNFIGTPGTTFSVSTADPDRDSLLLLAGATMKVAGNTGIFVRYVGDILASNRQAHAGLLGVWYEF